MSSEKAMLKECLKWPEVREGKHHGKVALYVGKSLFATLGKGKAVVGLEPEHAAMLVDQDPRFTAYKNAPHAVEFEIAKVPEWKELARESYTLAKK